MEFCLIALVCTKLFVQTEGVAQYSQIYSMVKKLFFQYNIIFHFYQFDFSFLFKFSLFSFIAHCTRVSFYVVLFTHAVAMVLTTTGPGWADSGAKPLCTCTCLHLFSNNCHTLVSSCFVLLLDISDSIVFVDLMQLITADLPITRTTGFSAMDCMTTSPCEDAVGAKSKQNLWWFKPSTRLPY